MLCVPRGPREGPEAAASLVSRMGCPQCFSLDAPAAHLRLPGFCNASVVLITQCFSRVDVAHLVLYHLSVCCKKKYFDFDREILPFTSENWDSLLLGEVGGVEAWGRGEREGITAL